jgi:carboxylesterase
VIEYYQDPRFSAFAMEHPGPDNRAGVMLVHGFTGTPVDMRPLARHLFDQGFDCHVPMHPGMGTDIANLATVTAGLWRKAALHRWAEHTGRYDRTVLIGYSMGGAAAIQMAAQSAPGLLILIAPFHRINDRRAPLLPVAKRVIKEFNLLGSMDFDNPNVRQWFKAALPGIDIDDPENQRKLREETGIASPVIDELRKFGALGRRDASKVTSPVAIIQGHQDHVVNPRHSRQLGDLFVHLQAYHEVPGDHLLPMDTLPSWPRVKSLVLDEIRLGLGGAPATGRENSGDA